MVSTVLPAECWAKKRGQESTKSKDSDTSHGDSRSEDAITLILYDGYKERFDLQKKYPSSHQMKEQETKFILSLTYFG